MDELKNNTSEDEFHDCLDDVSDTTNTVKEFEKLSTDCNDQIGQESNEKQEEHSEDMGDERICPSIEGPDDTLKAKAECLIQENTSKEDESSGSIRNSSSLVDAEIKGQTFDPSKELNCEHELQHSSSNAETPVENIVEQSTSKSINRDNSESSDESEDESYLTASEIEERTSEAKKLKVDGNAAYNEESLEEAIRLYSEGIKICPKCSRKDRAILFSNRSACYAKMDRSDDAIQDCTSAIFLHPQYLKVYLRRAQLYDKAEKYEEATKDYEKILELDPSIHSARKALMSMPEKIEIRNEKLKQQMMSSLKDLGNLFLRPFGLSTDHFQMQQNPDTGSYNIQFNNNPGT